METVLVQVPAPDGGPPTQVVHVQPGETLRFGRGAEDCDGEIVRRLHGHERCRDLTRAAVNPHIDYLAIEKLRVKEPRPGADERLDTKREALVSVALRFGLVRDEHRRLLPPRT